MPGLWEEHCTTRSRQTVTFWSTVLTTSAYLLQRLKTKFGERAFSHAGPSAWNALPTHTRDVLSPNSFRKLLKTHFFSLAFNVHCLAFFPLLTHAHQPVYILLSLSKASNPFPEILQHLFGIKNQVSAISQSELYLCTIFYPITKVIGRTAIMT